MPVTGLNTRLRVSRVCAEATWASAVRSAASASSTAFCVPAEVFSSAWARSDAALALVSEASAIFRLDCCNSSSTVNRDAPSPIASPSRTVSVMTRPISSGLTKIRSASTQP